MILPRKRRGLVNHLIKVVPRGGGVCHPASYVEKNPVPAARKRGTSSTVANPYSKDAFCWSDDDDFQF